MDVGGSVFAGRQRELTELESALGDALAGRARLVVVSGEAGIGKTALADELALRAARRGARATWARCPELAGVPPFWPWAEILRGLLAEDAVRGRLDASTLAACDTLTGSTPPADTEADGSRFALFDSVRRALQVAGEVSPRLIVLDDVHAADAASMELLRFVAAQLQSGRCLILAATRPVAHRSAALASVTGTSTVIALPLRGLDQSELSVLIESLSGARPRPETVTAVHDATSGNPFFAESLVRLLQRDLRLEELDASAPMPLPDSVLAVLRQRIERVPDRERTVLTLLAAAGRTFERQLATALAGTVELADGAIEAATSEALVEPLPGHHGAFRFAHALVNSALLDDAAVGDPAPLHARVADVLEKLHQGHLEAHLPTLAHHYGLAGDALAAKAFDYSRRAGARARAQLAFEDAAAHYEAAIEHGQRGGLTGTEITTLLIDLGEARIRAGQIELGRTACNEAFERATGPSDGHLMARAALTYSSPPVDGGIVNEKIVRMIGTALAEIGDESPHLRARLRARLGAELMLTVADETRETLAREAVREARATGDDRVLATALRFAQSALATPQHVEECLTLTNEAIEAARRLGDVHALVDALAYRSVHHLTLGAVQPYADDVATIEQIAGEVPTPAHRWYTAVAAASRALLLGRLDEAPALIDATLDHASETPNAMASWQFQHFALQWERGGLETFEDLLATFPQARPGVGFMARAAIALIQASTGRAEEARAGLQDLAAELSAHHQPWIWLLSAAWLVDAADRVGDAEAARLLQRALEPYERLHVIGATGTVAAYWGSVSRLLANLALLLGDEDRAVQYADQALTAHTRVGSRPYVARSQAELARTLLARGRAGDNDRAVALIEEASAAAARMGLTSVEALLDSLDPLSPSVVAPKVAHESARATHEGEYWTLNYGRGVVRLRDTKGVRYLVTLLERPNDVLSALELVGAERGEGDRASRPSAAAEGLRTTEDAGSVVLDDRAKREYRQRLEDLDSEIDEAEANHDSGRSARFRAEREFLVAELARAVGLAGRDRPLGSAPSEQARVAVTKAIRGVLRKVETADTELSRHLRATIRTGAHCAYQDDVEPTAAWRVER